MAKKVVNPPKETCKCGAFCLEDTARTGRVCKLEISKKSKKS